jgi:hypothetical protein
MPIRAMRCGVHPVIVLPQNFISPDAGGSRPAVHFMALLFPMPFLPSSDTHSPSSIAIDMSKRTWDRPYRAQMPFREKSPLIVALSPADHWRNLAFLLESGEQAPMR